MNFAQPFGLLALLAIPAVCFLHWFRRRLAQRNVAALFLFSGQELVAAAGRQRTRLLRSASLYLECLAAALLAAYLSGPTFGGTSQRHVVLVLDDSASMQAGETPQRVLAAVRATLRELGSGDRVSLLRTGPRSATLCGPRALAAEVEPLLRQWRPAQGDHDLRPTLDLARELAAGGGEIVLYTDRAPLLSWPDITIECLGVPRPNAAILAARRLRGARGDEELHLAIGGFGGASQTHCQVSVDDQPLHASEVVLGLEPARLQVALPKGADLVRVQLSDDAFALDNTALLVPEPLRIVQAADLLPAERSAALGLGRAMLAIDQLVVTADPLQAQVVFCAEPGSPVAGQIEVVLPAGETTAAAAFAGPFAVEGNHPWTLGVTLSGVSWLAHERSLPGNLLIAAGQQGLVSEEFLAQGQRLWINLDPQRGNFVRAPDWPILLSNVVDQARAVAPGVRRSNVMVGSEAQYRRSLRADGNDAQVTLVAPDGSSSSGVGGALLGWQLQQPGIHLLLGRDGNELGRVAARFHDANESNLNAACSKRIAATELAASDGDKLRDTTAERRWLALLLFAALLLDWWCLASSQQKGAS